MSHADHSDTLGEGKPGGSIRGGAAAVAAGDSPGARARRRGDADAGTAVMLGQQPVNNHLLSMHIANTKNRLIVLMLAAFALAGGSVFSQSAKTHSAFYSPAVLAKIHASLEASPDRKQFITAAVTNAAYWHRLSDQQLRDLVFSSGITRSWMVWSDGYCPACKKPVRMYHWKIEAQKLPCKLRCPNCRELFPKNDFHAFYRSGLNERGQFDARLADRSLLFNADHPDPGDPLHRFGVDDGEGYIAEGRRWRFIGAYLIYGQFKQLVLGGARALATAYVLTGDSSYARQAGVLLDRLADFYPSFDYASQGLTYERAGSHGYISVWHDACEETRQLALAYDQIFDGFPDEAKRRNIEAGLLRHPLAHPQRVHSNFPLAEVTLTTLTTVLGWPENRAQVEAMVDKFIKQATAVDGVTGEKGLSGYTAYTIAGLARFLEQYCRTDSTFLSALIQRNPNLTNTWRFHIDTLCLDQFYPRSGDCGAFAQPTGRYVGAGFDKTMADPLAPSMFSFFWRLYEVTHDPGYVQILYRENGRTANDLPHDLFTDNSAQFQEAVTQAIREHGADLKLGSVNKQAWHLAILRSGKGTNARALWLDYDSWGNHSHRDGMTLGLFAHGFDLLPDFGYPPVQFGGWTTPRASWYMQTAAHNTVLVDRNQGAAAGVTTLWADGEMLHAVRADGPEMVGGKEYERTAALIDVGEEDFYVLDIFRTVAGSAHYKFVYGPFATLSTSNLNLAPSKVAIAGAQLRNFATAANPPPGWSAQWNIDDLTYHASVGRPKSLKMRYTDLSSGVEAITAEAWTATMSQLEQSQDDGKNWIPCLISRKTGPAPLSSTFVSVLDSFQNQPVVKSARRLPLSNEDGTPATDSDVAVELELRTGQKDLWLSLTSVTKNKSLFQPDWHVELGGDSCWLRLDKQNRLERLALYRCGIFRRNDIAVSAGSETFSELVRQKKKLRVIRGDPNKVRVTAQ